MNKWLYALGVLLVLGFGFLGVVELNESQTPYITSVAELKTAGDGPVQFVGSIVQGSSRYSDSSDELLFTLKDKQGKAVHIFYKGVKPSGFDSASQAVVRGEYRGNGFDAEQVLVKCPSRYKGRQD
ncbi:MAG: cytochrome c maturation protein CcmE [Armatimonadota bacterium]|nr:cytochrome c maturation protein CcmE [bacterium]